MASATPSLPLLCLCVALLLILGCPAALSFQVGDPIPMLKRSQYKGQRSGWSEVLYRDCPRFAEHRTIIWQPLREVKDYDSTEPFKISFSFAHHQFTTPWITVTDGKMSYLHTLTFTFTSHHDLITAFAFHSSYTQQPGRGGDEDSSIEVRYEWDEVAEVNDSGVWWMLVVWLCAVWGAMMFGATLWWRGAGAGMEAMMRPQHTKGV